MWPIPPPACFSPRPVRARHRRVRGCAHRTDMIRPACCVLLHGTSLTPSHTKVRPAPRAAVRDAPVRHLLARIRSACVAVVRLRVAADDHASAALRVPLRC